MTATRCWIITEGAIGMESQCRGLAEALGLEPVVKRVNPRLPWLMLPSGCWPAPLASLGPGSDPIAPPWPELVISCGRKGVPFALAIKRRSPRTVIVHIQDPQMRSTAFDLVAAPRHDRVKGPNVIETRGALHPVSPARLAAAAAHFRARFAHLKRPLVAVLIGGSNGRKRLGPEEMASIADRLAEMARRYDAGLVVTSSRRTGEANIAVLRAHLAGTGAEIWDGTGENPYFGMLALADHIVVTSDSVSMATEACGTGKPVYIVELPGRAGRHGRFHDELDTEGIARAFEGRLETWTYEPVYDAARVADAVRRLLDARRP
ncbi:MAG TPA: mitochondrial fission ELM1 family protein [Alphaproteobacteria bacterium]|nr:mitochondrial fission ELM1 family protein [Alphaproteobacteria bacterium]